MVVYFWQIIPQPRQPRNGYLVFRALGIFYPVLFTLHRKVMLEGCKLVEVILLQKEYVDSPDKLLSIVCDKFIWISFLCKQSILFRFQKIT